MGHFIKQRKQDAVRPSELSWFFTLENLISGIWRCECSEPVVAAGDRAVPIAERSMLICSGAAVRMRGYMQEPTDLVVSGPHLNKNP